MQSSYVPVHVPSSMMVVGHLGPMLWAQQWLIALWCVIGIWQWDDMLLALIVLDCPLDGASVYVAGRGCKAFDAENLALARGIDEVLDVRGHGG